VTETCRKPDVDCPRLVCGAPMPCLRHIDVVMDLTKSPAEVRSKHLMPIQTAKRLLDIVDVLVEEVPSD
jgi:hypothetical protein